MPEQRGKQATAEVKQEWTRAYQIYLRAPGDRYDKKKDRTSRIDSVAGEGDQNHVAQNYRDRFVQGGA